MKKIFFVFVALFFVVNSASSQINFGGAVGYAKLLPFMGAYITEVRANGQVMIEIAPGVTYALRASWFPGSGSVPSGCTVAEAIKRTIGHEVNERARRAGVEVQGTDSSTNFGGYLFGGISASKAKKATAKKAEQRRAAAAAPTTRTRTSDSAAKAPIRAKYELNIDTGKITKIDQDYDF
jgi:hypothetical protein